MCGICGVVRLQDTNNQVVDEGILKRMSRSLSHRGPDGEGTWCDHQDQIGFGHRRLKIIDLTDAGRQPMCNEDGNVWITFNGEIYNHMELRQQLERLGHRYRSRTDTETIIHAYEEWGIDCIHRLDGMFAFALWDGRGKKLYLVRDRLGIKPLYYAVFGKVLLFASEPKGILPYPNFPREMDLEAFYDFLSFCAVPAPRTMFKGISKLPAGHYLAWSPGQSIAVHRYWDAFEASARKYQGIRIEEDEAVEEVRRLLRSAVSKRLMSDVPFGVFLSGGIDSSTIVGFMAEILNHPVDTYSVALAGQQESNELDFAQQVASLFQTNHRQIVLSEEQFLSFLPKMSFFQDSPVADPVSVPQYYLSMLARESGTIVLQVGEGSDELFFGYPTYISYINHKAKIFKFIRSLPSSMRTLIVSIGASLRPDSKSLHYLRRGQEPFWGGAIAVLEKEKRHLLAPGVFEGRDSYRRIQEFRALLSRTKPEFSVPDYVTALDLYHRLPELLLMRTDRMGMANSIELRVPFLDQSLVEFVVALPHAIRVQNNTTKFLLKRALRGFLPDNIIDRPKRGFAGSWNNMVTDSVVNFARTILLDERCGISIYLNEQYLRRLFEMPTEAIPKGTVWALLVAGLWHRYWIDGVGE